MKLKIESTLWKQNIKKKKTTEKNSQGKKNNFN